jgi:HAD superfamily hydrolase (TIGR01549 family)
MPITTVFFDIGDVLFSEDAPHAMLLHCVYQALSRSGVDVSWDRYAAQFRQCMRCVPATAVQDAVSAFIGNPAASSDVYDIGHDMYQQTRYPRRYGMLLDDITDIVAAVHQSYKTGIIANQHPVIMDALSDYRLLMHFDVIVIDEIVGVSKPDPAIFLLACERAGCLPREAIMVGDRPENDIAPAKRLGMGTVRFRRGTFYAHYDPLIDDERADIEVRSAIHIPGAINTITAWRSGA